MQRDEAGVRGNSRVLAAWTTAITVFAVAGLALGWTALAGATYCTYRAGTALLALLVWLFIAILLVASLIGVVIGWRRYDRRARLFAGVTAAGGALVVFTLVWWYYSSGLETTLC